MRKKTNEYGLEKLKEWEGCHLGAYQDKSCIWTIGYGLTGGSGVIKPVRGMKMIHKQPNDLLINRQASEIGRWAKSEFVLSGYAKSLLDNENVFIKPETLGPIPEATAGLTSLAMLIVCLISTLYFIRQIRRKTA
ncbi:MAG: hypothetical protein JSC189_000447 [Candidatus Tokpelaia sp. JSC189]|nr:MAG: hypothetical protein JSC189_000447 [Candidatus Tokpelaia sp. JSC189]